LVYPDATHTRFSHSLGTLRAAQDLLDVVLDQQNRREPQRDLFAEWRQKEPRRYNRKVAEVVVLTRLGALLHDIGHIPFGHTIEDDLGLLLSHDRNVPRFDRLWAEVPAWIRELMSNRFTRELRRLILSKEKTAAGGRRRVRTEYPFVADLVGNTICADLLDYLERDHKHLGLPLELGHRFLEGMYVTPSDHPNHPERVVVELHRKGEDRSDVITELLKYLRYRYEESERALRHHAKLSADAMIGKLLAMWRDALWIDLAYANLPVPPEHRRDIDQVRDWIEQQPNEALTGAAVALGGSASATATGKHLIQTLDASAHSFLEDALVSHGDDGLLAMILSESEPLAATDSRRAAIGSLCRGVLDRQLYKRIGSSTPMDRDLAEGTSRRYGAPDDRRRLEIEAADFLGLSDRWHLVLWIPSPRMGLKEAEVLVGGGGHVSTLHRYSHRVREIYDMHEDLWAIGVYVHSDLRKDTLRSEVLLAWLREKLGLRGWTRAQPEEDWQRVAIRHFGAQHDIAPAKQEALLELAASGADPGLAGFMQQLEKEWPKLKGGN
jgi:hypothetical protein